MSNKKRSSLIAKPTEAQTFTELLFLIYTLLFFTIGFLLLFFTEEVSLLALAGEQTKTTIVVFEQN